MPEEKLRVGIVGTGVIAAIMHIPQLRATGRVEVVAVCRRDADMLAKVQKALGVPEAYTDWREMLERAQLDAVVVSTPHRHHVEPTMAALEKGLHVFVQKPMALTSRDAWAMVGAADRADRILMVHGAPTSGLWRTAKKRVDEGLLGPLRQISIAQNVYRGWNWGAPMPGENWALAQRLADMVGVPFEFFANRPGWRGDPETMGGGTFVDLGIYMVTHALWLADVPPLEVVAFTESTGLPMEVFVNAQACLANGVLFSMTFADAIPEPLSLEPGYGPSITVVGDQALLFQDREGTVWLHRGGGRERMVAELPDTSPEAVFVSAVLDGEPTVAHPKVGAWAVEFDEATYRSAAEGRIVRIERHNSG